MFANHSIWIPEEIQQAINKEIKLEKQKLIDKENERKMRLYYKSLNEYTNYSIREKPSDMTFVEFRDTIVKPKFDKYIAKQEAKERRERIRLALRETHSSTYTEGENYEARLKELLETSWDGYYETATKDIKQLVVKPLCEEEELNRNAEKNICLVVIFLFSVILCAFLAINGFMIALALLFAVGVACRELF